MNRELLLDEYARGAIGRRAFIRGLVADGVPLRIAAMHAGAIRPRPGVYRAVAADDRDQIPDADVEDDGRHRSRSQSPAPCQSRPERWPTIPDAGRPALAESP